MDYSKWFRNLILILISVLAGITILVILVDPFFHYHKPIVKYRLTEPRYTNDGISRHFDYDAIIVGTSMSQNFKTSQMDNLFGTKSVKMPYAGAGYEELSNSVRRSLERNPEIKTVLWVVDFNGLLRSADWTQYTDLPDFIYDNNPLNDAPYLFNKSVLYHALVPDVIMTLKGQESATMDSYSSWVMPEEKIIWPVLDDEPKEEKPFTKEDLEEVEDTFEKNFVDVISNYPNVKFYLYFTPYSIYNWYRLYLNGEINRSIMAQEIASRKLLSCSNVELYSFFDKTDIICDLSNYKDEAHYSPYVNELILQWIYEGEGLVDMDNLHNRIEEEQYFFNNFNYNDWKLNISMLD